MILPAARQTLPAATAMTPVRRGWALVAPGLLGCVLTLGGAACGNHAESQAPAPAGNPPTAADAQDAEAVPTPVTALHAPPAGGVGPVPTAASANVTGPASAPMTIAPAPTNPPPTLSGEADDVAGPGGSPTAAATTSLDAPQDRFFTGRTWTVVRSGSLRPGTTYRFEPDGRLVIANPGSPPSHDRWEIARTTGQGAGLGAQNINLREAEGTYPATLAPRAGDPDTLTLTVHGPGQPVIATLRGAPTASR